MNGREGLARAAAGFIPSKERPELVHTALDVSAGFLSVEVHPWQVVLQSGSA